MKQAVSAIKERDERIPEIALILGSGLGSLADTLDNPTVIPGSEIPGYPHAGVSGHRGDLVIGEMEGRVVVFLRGRFHRYEGHDVDTLTLPVRLAAAMGARRLIVTNAAGSLRTSMPAGSLMRITDHINTTTANPLMAIRQPGPNDPAHRGRRPGELYDSGWGAEIDRLALKQGVNLHHGVYVWTMGPSYETPAEIKYFRRIGGDAIGMSTVPEVSIAARLGLSVAGFSVITNLGAGLENVSLSHDDVLEVGKAVQEKLGRLLVAITASIPDS